MSRRQVASLDRRIFTGSNASRRRIMLRMVLLGLFIPLGVGVLAAMELRAPPRSAVAVVQPLAEPAIDISDSHGALARADRLEIAVTSSETPAQPAPADERISPSEDVSIGSSEHPRVIHRDDISDSHGALARADGPEIAVASSETPARPAPADEGISPSEDVSRIGSSEHPRVIHRHRLDPKSKKGATATRPKSTPKATDIKRPTIPQRSKAASNTDPCRLSAFGGLRKALHTVDCQI